MRSNKRSSSTTTQHLGNSTSNTSTQTHNNTKQNDAVVSRDPRRPAPTAMPRAGKLDVGINMHGIMFLGSREVQLITTLNQGPQIQSHCQFAIPKCTRVVVTFHSAQRRIQVDSAAAGLGLSIEKLPGLHWRDSYAIGDTSSRSRLITGGLITCCRDGTVCVSSDGRGLQEVTCPSLGDVADRANQSIIRHPSFGDAYAALVHLTPDEASCWRESTDLRFFT